MGLSDIIAQFILRGLEREDGALEISRVKLAERFNCAPSQINYVLTTRFTPEHGYIIETKRGGGGYIRVTRVRLSPRALVMHTVNAVGEQLSAASAAAFLENLGEVLGEPLSAVIAAACTERTLRAADPQIRDSLRADIFKQCLLRVM